MLPLAVQAAMAAIEKICPEAKQPAAHPGPADTQQFLSGLDPAPGADLQPGGAERAPGDAGPRGRQARHAGGARRRRTGAGARGAHTWSAGSEKLRPLHHLAEQRPGTGRSPCHTALARAIPAAAAARRAGRAPQEPALPELRRGGQEVCQAAGHGPVADQPLVWQLRKVDVSTPAGLDLCAQPGRRRLTEVQRKYKEYGINERPFVVVKTDNGSDGQGMIVLHDAKELEETGGRLAQRLRVAAPSSDAGLGVIVQEGVLTVEHMHSAVAEPVVLHDRPLRGGRLLPGARQPRPR